MATFFYAKNDILVSTVAERLRRSFNVLADLFGQVGLITNVGKTISMIFQSNWWE